MSYLVYCPTCDGKMSVNAQTCPHCGETEFFEETRRMESYPCDYHSPDQVLGCEGKGYLCRKLVYCSILRYDPEYLSCYRDGFRLGDLYIETSEDTALWNSVRKAIANDDYFIHITQGKHLNSYRLYISKSKCPACNGTGRQMMESNWDISRKDIRERV